MERHVVADKHALISPATKPQGQQSATILGRNADLRTSSPVEDVSALRRRSLLSPDPLATCFKNRIQLRNVQYLPYALGHVH